jgi:hypothetical protein
MGIRRGRPGRATRGTTAIVFGVMVLVASLPGAAVLVIAWFRRTGLRSGPKSRSEAGTKCLTAAAPP